MGSRAQNPNTHQTLLRLLKLSESAKTNYYVDDSNIETHVNEDITKVSATEIPDHDLLVGGFLLPGLFSSSDTKEFGRNKR